MQLFGGGGRSTSVADVPDNIKKMIEYYKKIATGSVNLTKDIKNGDIIFPVSLNFKPSIFIVKIKVEHLYADISYNLNSKDIDQKYIIETDGHTAVMNVTFRNNSGVISISNSTYYETYIVTDWIAIE